MKRIIYVSGTMDGEDFAQLFRGSAKIPGQQAQKFSRLMIKGLAGNNVETVALSGIPVTYTNCKKRFIGAKKHEKDGVLWHYPSVLNVRRIKNLWQMSAVFFKTAGYCMKRDSAVVCDVLNASVSYGAALAARLMGRECIGVVTDLPHLMVTGNTKAQTRLIGKITDKCTGYVLLTQAMNGEVNKKGKPYAIIEGLCDTNVGNKPKKSDENAEKICMYAGLLDARYGVKAMVDAFVAARVENASLHLYGSGPYAKELERIAKANPKIVYHGTVMNEEIVKAEQEASLLINPRPTHEEFTKYSFPSKNLEYMVSGTPVLTTCLPGMPKEYYPYVYLFKDESVLGMAKTLESVLSLDTATLEEKGRDAKKFVEENKNCVSQTQKLLEIL